MTKTLEPGTELDGGKYRILRLLGQGGMGTVFEAEHTETQKRVALKCIHPQHAADPEVAERLVREARATARVRHPNVVDVYDVGRDGTMVYLVMEYLEGEPLAHALLRRDLPMHGIIALLMPAIRGVAAAHRQGVIHRDLKPDNIFLAREGDGHLPVPKVLDFGISKLEVRGMEQRSLTRSGAAVGTPSYMSYEQLAGELEVDERADVYAFGVILYEALTGQVPYEADTFPELMIRFVGHVPAPPKQLRAEIPTLLSRIVMWALEKDRDARISSMEALAQELEPFATRLGFETERTQERPSVPPKATSALVAEAPKPGSSRSDSLTAAEIHHLPTNPKVPRHNLFLPVLVIGGLLLMAAGVALFVGGWSPRLSRTTQLHDVSVVTPAPRATAAQAPSTVPTENQAPVVSAVTELPPPNQAAALVPPRSAANELPRGLSTRRHTPQHTNNATPAPTTPPQRDLGIY